MSTSLLQPQGLLSPAQALELAQQAPAILRSQPRTISASPLASLYAAPETADLWVAYENLLLSCLRVGDDEAAHQCLERLILRFGDDNERILAFKGLIKEAEASDQTELEAVLQEYDSLLAQNGSNVPVVKRKVALLRSMNKIPESISALNSLLEFSPTDAEAWSELADLYVSQGLYSQAIYALEEAVVLQPNAWNVHARLGEIQLIASKAGAEGSSQKYLAESLKRFCRSIELCDDYLRGFYGLKMATDTILNGGGSASKKERNTGDFALPDQTSVQKLNQVATAKLAEIVRHYGAQEPLWQGYDPSEVAAARDLLTKTSPTLVR